MRTRRLYGQGRSFYHLLSRIIERRFLLNDLEKEYFRETMRKLEIFHGVRVVTFCIMSNHFHILLEVPDADECEALSKEEILRRVGVLQGSHAQKELSQEFERAEKSRGTRWEAEIHARYEERMGGVSNFTKELKQRFTQWYNRRESRRGPLWEERFKSVLVEDTEQALLTVAAYIDLNPVRAGMVSDPKDYRWSGYGEAVAGVEKARRALGCILAEALWMTGEVYEGDWKKTGSRYRLLLYGKGEEETADAVTGKKGRRGLSRSAIDEENAREGQLSVAEVLRCRVRYFSDGCALGTAEFVESVFQANRSRYGANRKKGAKKMRGADWEGLCTLRDLQKDVIIRN